MKYQKPVVISFIIAIFLLGAIFYSGALTQPYSGDSEPYSVAHESTAAFNETHGEEPIVLDLRTSVDELSEDERRAFENAKEQPPRESDSGPNGWRSLGEPPVCDKALLLCNEYEEIPNPSSHNDTFTLVEDSNGEIYVVRVGFNQDTGAVWHFDGIIKFFTKLFILGPYALFLAYRGWARSSRQPTRVSMSYGGGLATIVFAYPYFLMFTDISLPSWHLPALAALTWAVIFVEIGRGYWQRD